MTTNNITNDTNPSSLARGGTNANLTASNGGIFYSTGSAGAILSGTATPNQLLLSGATGAPAWSTVTHPATTTINQILYSSSANVLAGLASANSAVLVTGSTGVPVMSSTMTNGQLIIGSTGATPTAATLTAGSNVTITNGAGSITIAASGGGSGNYVWLATETASNSATLDFVSVFSTSYVAYIVILDRILPATSSASLNCVFGTGSSPTWIVASNYGDAGAGNAAGTGSNNYSSASAALIRLTSTGIANSGGGVNGQYTVTGCDGTNSKLPFIMGTSLCTNTNGSSDNSIITAGGSYAVSQATTSLRFEMSSGNITSGNIYIFGLST